MGRKSVNAVLLSNLLRIETLIKPLLSLLRIKFVLNNSINLLRPKIIFIPSYLREIQDFLIQLQPKYNGFDLERVGGDGDGGYLVPNDLQDIAACFSAGCDNSWNFERDLETNYGIKSFILDKADKMPRDLTPMQIFRDGWLADRTGEGTVTLEDWVNQSVGNVSADLLLQMDIEGAEYSSLLETPRHVLQRFRILVVEFHNLPYFVNYNGFKNTYLPAFEKLLQDFDVVHFHANNCCGNWRLQDFDFPKVVEITLHRRDRRLTSSQMGITPQALDRKNVPSNPDIQVDWSLINFQNGQKKSGKRKLNTP